MDYLEKVDLDAEHHRLLEIARWTAAALRDLGCTVYGRHDDLDSAVVSFLHPALHAEDMAHLLDAQGYAVAPATTAPNLLHRLGISSTVRASFYLYNTMEEAKASSRPWNTCWTVSEGRHDLRGLAGHHPELAEIEDRMERFEFIFDLAEDVLNFPLRRGTTTTASRAASRRPISRSASKTTVSC